jgi:hypothetical protein
MWLDGGVLVAPDENCDDVNFYDYPAGGDPIKTLTGFVEPFGSTVSVAPQ